MTRDRRSLESLDPEAVHDSTVLTEEVGAKRVDEDGHVLQEPDLERRMIVEVEIY
jgi:hypothetical protein